MLVGPEDMGNVWHQFHLVPHERVRSVLLARDGSAQAAQHHRTHFQRSLAKVGDLHVRLKRTDLPRLILSDHKFQVVVAGSEHKSSAVLNVLPADLLRAIHCKLYRVTQLSDREFSPFTNLTDDVDRRVVLLFLRNEGDL